MNEHFGEYISELRKKSNLSQEELAERIGVSRQAISKWERGVTTPDTHNITSLADVFGLSVDQLINSDVKIPAGKASKSGSILRRLIRGQRDDLEEDNSNLTVRARKNRNNLTGALVLVAVVVFIILIQSLENASWAWVVFLIIPIGYQLYSVFGEKLE